MPANPSSTPPRALSFASVADAYDRARPSYPREAAQWLVGSDYAHVLELGAGTGKLTQQLEALGHRVIATDPLEPMLRHLVTHLPTTRTVAATAERIPLRSRSVDAVIGAQAFHWFDHAKALPEIARVLRPGGHLGLVWNHRDDRVPWVKRLGALIGTQDQEADPTNVLLSSHLFGYVETSSHRFWQKLDRSLLRDLVASRSNVASMGETERERVLRKVDELYADYGRGPDGMLLPYVTHCYRAVVRPPAVEEEGPPSGGGRDEPDDPESLLIDFG